MTLDTNAILRYLLEKTAQLIENGSKSYPEIIAEVVYVLVKLYSVPREKISEIVAPITYEIEFDNADVVRDALSNYSQTKFDFVDCLLIARNQILGEEIFTFDKKLANRLKK